MKRTLQKVFSLLLCAAILVVPAFAAGESGESADETGPVMVWGTLTWLDDGGLLLQNDSETSINEVILHGESIICLDAVTGEPIDIKSLKDGDTVYAWVSPVMTMSLPPHATAYLILGNIPADYRVPMYYEIAAANVTGTDRDTQMPTSVELTAVGGVVFTVTNEATLTPYLTKNVVTLGDLVPGTRVLVWSNSRGEAERVLVFPYEYRAYISLSEDGGVSVSGQAVEQAAKTTEDGTVLLPIRAISEALGLSVSWDPETGVTVAAGGSETAQTIFVAKPDGAITGVNAYGSTYEVSGTCINDDGVTFLTDYTFCNLLDLYLVK